MTAPSVSITLTGSGGSGVMTAGNLLLEAAGHAGWYGLMTRSSGPQIRGGEAAAMLRFSSEPVRNHQGRFDLLLGIDWKNAERFANEIPLDGDSLLVGEGEAPDVFARDAGQAISLDITRLAKTVEGGRANMVALGVAAAVTGLPAEALEAAIARSLERKGEAAVRASIEACRCGLDAAAELPRINRLEPRPNGGSGHWNISGNEACGLGALRGGTRFVAAYPITPATEILEWLAGALPRVGGVLVQAEDELASANQVIGASFGGVPALTATSGPGLALMMESLGLAVASETPMVVINVMRGGPSTGIPTKSEQADLGIALQGFHGDAPHLVTAPLSIADCLFTTQWTVHLAEKLQTAAILLSDQFLGQTRALIDPQADAGFQAERLKADFSAGDYQRYALTESGISPMAIPGQAGGEYVADGLEHNERGTPSSQAEDHHRQLDKRQRKLENHDFGAHWAHIEGDPVEGEAAVGENRASVAVLTWGSSYGAASEAVASLRQRGHRVRLIAMRLLLPVSKAQLEEALEGISRVLVVEQSQGAQFYHYLRAYYDIRAELSSLAQPGPLPIEPETIQARLSEWS